MYFLKIIFSRSNLRITPPPISQYPKLVYTSLFKFFNLFLKKQKIVLDIRARILYTDNVRSTGD